MKRGHGRGAVWLVGLLLAALCSGNGWSLTDEEVFRDFRFNFISPGARALGLGGAYIAAADDATAAEANPAALHYINRYEAFIEYRQIQSDNVIFRPSTPGVFDPTDPNGPDFTDFTTVTKREDAGLLSFASFSIPFRIGSRRATIALSRQVVLNIENSLSDPAANQFTTFQVSLDEFPLIVDPGPPPSVQRYSISNDVSGFLDSELIHYNLSFSMSLTDHFSLGITGTLAELDMESQVDSQINDPRGIVNSVNPRVDLGGSLSDVRFRTSITDSDSSYAYTIGLHWHPDRAFPNRQFVSPIRFGLVYRKGADLEVQETAAEADANGSFDNPSSQTFATTLRVPDRFGVGVSYETQQRNVSRRASSNWVLALDYERIQFSDLLDGFRPGVNFFTQGRIDVLQVNPDELVFDVDDANVIHAGAEWFVTTGNWAYALRAGYFNAPDSRIRLVDAGSVDATTRDILFDLFRAGEDQDHFTAGFSVRTPIGLRIQLAGNFSDDQTEALASMVWRFGKTRR